MVNKLPIQNWIVASRPKTLPAAIAPVMVGTALAFHDYHFHFFTAVATFLSAICIQIGTNFSNDLSDFLKGTDSQDRIGPVRTAQSGLLTISQLKTGTIIIFLSAILFGCYLVYVGGLPIVIVGLSSITAGILYTAGPYPFGYYGLGDIFVFLFFGIIAVSGTYYLQTGYVTTESFLCGVAIGSLATAILVVNNLRDADIDVKTGKKTLAVIFGILFSKLEYSLLISIPFVVLIFLYFQLSKLSICLPIFLLPMGGHLISVILIKTGTELNLLLVQTARFLFLYATLLSIGLVL